MIIYADVLFLVNFWMDMICLRLIACLTRSSENASLLRLMLAAAVGALIACVWEIASCYLTQTTGAGLKVIIAIGTAALIYRISCPLSHFRQMICGTTYFLLLAFVVSGIADWIYYDTFWGYQIAVHQSLFLGGLTMGIFFALMIGARAFLKKKIPKKTILSFWLLHGDHRYHGQALVDTGNCLYTYDGKPVQVLELQELKNFLPHLYEAVRKTENIGLNRRETKLEQAYLEQFRFSYLPYKSAGGDGIFMAVTFDKMLIEKSWGNQVVYQVTFALTERNLAGNKQEYHAIIHER